jgi:hypothetical protein
MTNTTELLRGLAQPSAHETEQEHGLTILRMDLWRRVKLEEHEAAQLLVATEELWASISPTIRLFTVHVLLDRLRRAGKTLPHFALISAAMADVAAEFGDVWTRATGGGDV